MRLAISPIFFLIYAEYNFLQISETILPYLLLFLLLFAEATDGLDGYLARKYRLVTDFGKVLDPMADSIYHISLFLAFTLPPVNLPIAPIIIFLYRDFLISTLRTLCALRGVALAARASGKLKAALQALATVVITALLIPYFQGSIEPQTLENIAAATVYLVALYSLISGIDYLIANRKHIKASLKT